MSVNTVLEKESIEESVQQVFGEVTRYPLDILELEADLEEDLGIDSVKLGEVFSVLQEKYRFPEDIDVSTEKTRTIRDVAQIISDFVSEDSKDANDQAALSHDDAQQPDVVEVSSQRDGNGNLDGGPSLVNDSSDEVVKVATSQGHKPFFDKVALVTDADRGLGKVIAHHLAEQGATVIVNSFHSIADGEKTVAEIKSIGGKAAHIEASLANDAQLHKMFDEIESEFEGLDFFICNAANGTLANLEDVKPEHWESAFRTNVIALHQAALRAAKMMAKRGGGQIITLSSAGSNLIVEYYGCMGPIKAAVESLTQYLAVEFAPSNIEVNCINAGPIYDDLLINGYPDRDRLIPYWESLTARKKICKADQVCSLMSFLLSEKSTFVNGSVVMIDDAGSVPI